MGEVVGELARAQDALARPTLRLLDGKWAAFRVAVLRCAFSRDRRSVPADRLHAQVDAYLDDFGPGWRRGTAERERSCSVQLLGQRPVALSGQVGRRHPGLLPYIVGVGSAGPRPEPFRDRVLVSESRLTTILDTVRRWAMEASPDAQARIDRLNARIRELELERDRLAAGGEVAAASDDRMLDGYTNLIDLVGQLPSDFKRVEESVLGMHRAILRDFRDDDRPVVDVLDEYLDEQDELVRATPEGRAFDGAFVLLRDDALLLELRENVGVLLAHPAAAALDAHDVSEIRGAVTVIRQGIKDVLAQRRRITATLQEHIVNHDVLEERELNRVLRGIERELATWLEVAEPRTTVPIELLPPIAKVGHLRTRPWDPSSAIPPPPLEESDDDAEHPSVADLRMQGGPSLDELREALVATFTSGGIRTVGELFDRLPNELRRPVEILGLLHVLSRVGALKDDTAVEEYTAIRPDGARRGFLVPRSFVDWGVWRARLVGIVSNKQSPRFSAWQSDQEMPVCPNVVLIC